MLGYDAGSDIGKEYKGPIDISKVIKHIEPQPSELELKAIDWMGDGPVVHIKYGCRKGRLQLDGPNHEAAYQQVVDKVKAGEYELHLYEDGSLNLKLL